MFLLIGQFLLGFYIVLSIYLWLTDQDFLCKIFSPMNCFYKQRKRNVPNENKEQDENVSIKQYKCSDTQEDWVNPSFWW